MTNVPAGNRPEQPTAASPTSDAETLPAPTVAVTPLLAEAAAKSDISWIEIPGDRAFAIWHTWAQDRFYVVSGQGEQLLPPLPEVVHVILRSKDTGGALLTVAATAHLLEPGSPSWDEAVAVLGPKRLNTTDDYATRWADAGSVYALHPYGAPLAAPGSHGQDSGRAPITPAAASTVGWRPWHAGRS
ncbi:MAG TPA: hypothetical protein GXZ60_11900 [Intrasporangiaceae bacterium]|nr:hypothetical protein [Intrasporangiaceae bacterium]